MELLLALGMKILVLKPKIAIVKPSDSGHTQREAVVGSQSCCIP